LSRKGLALALRLRLDGVFTVNRAPTFSGRTWEVSAMDRTRHVIETTINGSSVGLLEWVADPETHEIRITVNSSRSQTGPVKAVWKVDWKQKSLALDLAQLPSMSGTCLAGCLIGAGAALAKCLLNATSEDEVWRCLDEHSDTTGAGILGCIIGCL
jgi:hypothetical protein